MSSIDQLFAELRSKDIKLVLDGDRLKLNAPQGVLTPDLQAQLKARKPELIAFLQNVRSSQASLARIVPMPREGPIPLSYAQEGAWFIDQLQPGVTFNIALSVRFGGRVDLDLLGASLNELVARQEALRTTFGSAEGRPFQVVNPPWEVPIEVEDLTGLSSAEADAGLLKIFLRETQAPFNLTRLPLLRVTIIRRSEQDEVVLLVVHHSVFDGWSTRIFCRELGQIYDAKKSGWAPELSPMQIQYGDYCLWQRDTMRQGEFYQSHIDFWRQQLADYPPGLQLAVDRPSSEIELFKGDAVSLDYPASLGRRLRNLAQEEGVTLFMLTLAAYKALLMRYGGQEDIIVGTAIANRAQKEMADVIGFCVNLLPLRTDLSGNPTFRELMKRERETCLQSYTYQELPFGLVVQELVTDRNVGHSPMFQVQFALTELEAELVNPTGLPIRPLFDSNEIYEELNPLLSNALPAFDHLSLYLTETHDYFRATLHYRMDIFEQNTIRRMLDHLGSLLNAVVDDPSCRILDLPLLAEEERTTLLEQWSSQPRVDSGEQFIHQLFEQHAAETPEATAVVVPGSEQNDFTAVSITYGELNRRANRVAHYLGSLGLAPETPVGISMDKSVDLIVTVLGVLKAGAAFVALDHAHGSERFSYMLGESRVKYLVTHSGLLDGLDAGSVHIIELDNEQTSLAEQSDKNPGLAVAGEQLAYMVYTSGSTGRPKGVMVTHRSIGEAYRAWESAYTLSSTTSHLQMANFAFDVFVGDLTRSLCSGAQLVLAPRDTLLAPDKLEQLLRDYRVDCAEFVPAVLRPLMTHLTDQNARLEHMKLFIVGSDYWSAAEFSQVRTITSDSVRLINSYGVAEATVDSCYFEDPSRHLSGDHILPIGQPFPGSEMYVLDPRLQPAPIGVPGELYIGGGGLARGYHARPDLTAERFIPHPFSTRPSDRIYRTGDRARWRADGQLELIGRVDHQVKIRGFRIEPGEIQAVLDDHPAVQRSLVLARAEKVRHDPRLVAYLILNKTASAAVADEPEEAREALERELTEHLRNRLPDYMVPAAFVMLETFPLSPNGKVNRRALPAPEAPGGRHAGLMLPRTPTEVALAEIWRRVLGVEVVGANSDFFALGGHSLKASEIIYRIREAMDVDLPLRTVFEAPTLERLARAIDGALNTQESLPPVKPVPRSLRIPLSYAQEGAWFVDQLQPGVPFNIPLPWHLKGPLDLEVLERALARALRRHEVLRTTFTSADGEPYQVIAPYVATPLNIVDLRHLTELERKREMVRRVINSASYPFNLKEGPLLRMTIFRMGDEDQVILLTVHHIVFDGQSVNILARDLAILYDAERTGGSANLPALPIQYADYAVWQRKILTGDFLQTQLNYWRNQLADCPTGLNLVADQVAPDSELFSGDAVAKVLSLELSSALRELCQREGSTLFMLLLAAFKSLLARYTGQEDIVVGTPVANRNQSEMTDVIGFCVNMLALRTDLSGNPSFSELLGREREVCLGAYSHQELPFGLLVQHLRPDRHVNHSPFFSVGFGLHQSQGTAFKAPQFEASTISESDVEIVKNELETRRADITPSTDLLFLQMADAGEQIAAVIQHSSGLFSSATVEAMMGHLERILVEITTDPHQRLFDIPLLEDSELRRLVKEFNDTELTVPGGLTLHGLFETQAERRPDNVALIVPPVPGTDRGEEQLSYAELNEKANRLARYLIRQGVAPEARVGICLERSSELLIAVWAVLKAGAAFVPIDPAQGLERINFMLEDSRASVVLTHRGLTSGWGPGSLMIDLDHLDPALAELSGENLDRPVDPEQLAYVIYTSGSTGKPKGVMVPHRSLVNAYLGWESAYGLEALSCHLQMASFSFDVFAGDLTRTLCSGARMILCPRESLLVPSELADLIDRYRVECAEFVPAVIRPLAEYLGSEGRRLESLKLTIVGSDVWYVREYQELAGLLGDEVRLVNSYGVAEATIDSTWFQSSGDLLVAESLVPIGKPFANCRAYVLDPYLNPVPLGAAGELYLAGAGVSRGYSDRVELTAERFVPDPFSTAPGARLYRTGDRARYLPDGNIAFLGRVDNQLKIRGYRIEPGEIESVLEQHPAVTGVAVIAVTEANGENRLVAYLARAEEVALQASEVRTFLEGKLPLYMVPSLFVIMDEFPLTPSGKLDRRALPAPSGLRPDLAEEYVAPSTPVEEEIARIWGDVLAVEKIGVNDNFFSLGGHSLLAARLVARVRTNLQVDLPLRLLFEHPSVAGMAQAVEAALAGGAVPDEDLDLEAEAVLSADIVVTADLRSASPSLNRVLLTGASGFLGAYLLRELLDQTGAEVLCLVRAPDEQRGRERLLAGLESFGLAHESDRDRIVPVIGDLGQARFGLTDEIYEELASTVDAIYHNGAWVNFVYPYGMLKASNVRGTEEVLRLACREVLKPVHYVSTLSVFPAKRWIEGTVVETFRCGSGEGIAGGYAQSKWVAEQLMNSAFERGLPVAVYRPGRVTGDSRTGATSETVPMEGLESVIELGIVPRIDGPTHLDIVPVDFVAQAIVHLSRSENALGTAFHLNNPTPGSQQDVLAAFRGAGFSLREVDPREWAIAAFDHIKANPSHPLNELVPLMPQQASELLEAWRAETAAGNGFAVFPSDPAAEQMPAVPGVENANTLAGLKDSTIVCAPVANILKTYVEYLLRTGQLAPPGPGTRLETP